MVAARNPHPCLITTSSTPPAILFAEISQPFRIIVYCVLQSRVIDPSAWPVDIECLYQRYVLWAAGLRRIPAIQQQSFGQTRRLGVEAAARGLFTLVVTMAPSSRGLARDGWLASSDTPSSASSLIAWHGACKTLELWSRAGGCRGLRCSAARALRG